MRMQYFTIKLNAMNNKFVTKKANNSTQDQLISIHSVEIQSNRMTFVGVTRALRRISVGSTSSIFDSGSK